MIENIISEFVSTAANLTGVLKNISGEDSSRKKSPDAWSAIECVEHVIMTESAVTRILLQRAQDTHPNGLKKELIGKERIETALNDRLKKYTSPASLTPRGRYLSLDEAIEAFQRQRNNLIEMLLSGRIEFDGLTRAHPLLGEMTKIDWLHFLIEHCKRHREQIMETLHT